MLGSLHHAGKIPGNRKKIMTTSKDATLAAAAERLIGLGRNVDLSLRPAQGQNKSTATVWEPDNLTAYTFEASSPEELAVLLEGALRDTADIIVGVDAKRTLRYLTGIGSLARFIPVDAEGDLVIQPELDTPLSYRQLAAALRNGLKYGAAAVYDITTGVVTPIEALT